MKMLIDASLLIYLNVELSGDQVDRIEGFWNNLLRNINVNICFVE